MPDLKSLKHFLHLSESLHFGRSSEALYVSPSTLSRSISKLEDEVGYLLFIRDNRTVALTEAGIKFRVFAHQTLTAWRELQDNMVASSGDLVGRIRIYCSVTASYSFMSTILTRFRELHPKCEVSLITGDASFAVDKILDQEADIAIAPLPDHMPGQLCFQKIKETPLQFIMPSFDCAVRSKVCDPGASWSDIPLVLPEFGLSRKRVDAWFKKHDLKPNIEAEVVGHEAIVSMVGLGMGVGVVPELVIESSPMKSQVEIVVGSPELNPYQVGMVVIEKRLQERVQDQFWSVVLELVDSNELG